MSNLFSEFQSISAKEWKQKIQADLKGADYNAALIWKTNTGIDVKPFYHKDNATSLNYNTNTPKKWNICQSINVENAVSANKKAVNAINNGVESLKFIVNSDTISIQQLLDSINPKTTPIHFETSFLSKTFTKKLNDSEGNENIYQHNDSIGQLAQSGNFFSSLSNDFKTLEAILEQKNNLASVLSINLSLYQNAGATSIQQLAYGLAHANEYLNQFKHNFPKTIVFNVAISANYFFEIAKLRALRWLWGSLIKAYNINSKCHIFAQPTKRNKTIYDYNTNMLRTTTECMSAVLGGANSICNLPYDTIYKHPNTFSERIARNQLLILKKESYFSGVSNPADGSYYIEDLTLQLAEKALIIFKQIEAQGGFLKQLKNGIIQKKIKESAVKEQQQFNDNQIVLLGTNKHPNLNDKMKNNLEISPFRKPNPRKTLIEPIIEKRLAEENEQKRLKTEIS